MSEPSIEEMRAQIAFVGPEDALDDMPASRVRWFYLQQQGALQRARGQQVKALMIDPQTGRPDPDHPHVQQLAQLRPDQLRGFAMKLDEISGELFHVARKPPIPVQSLTGGGVPTWLVDLYNKFGPIVLDMMRAYFLKEAGVDIGAGPLQSRPTAGPTA